MNIDKKYSFYEESVQNPENDVEFINEKFKELKNRKPTTLREDFGGTGYLCCEWVKQGPEQKAYVIDLDPEPMNYGKKKHWGKLNEEQQSRVEYHELNVFDADNVTSDVVVAFNFSYFIFKKRQELVDYFSKVRQAMDDDGVFFLDMFGGGECYEPLEEETEHDDFTYFWDLDKFNPINNNVLYYIHFQEDGKDKWEKVFTYDWRMWSIPEIRECLIDAGFNHTVVYWEGDDDDGGGNGEFEVCEETEQCDSWVVYLAAYN